MKVCTKCGIKKSKSEFNRRKDSIDGYRSVCKECVFKNYKKKGHDKKKNKAAQEGRATNTGYYGGKPTRFKQRVRAAYRREVYNVHRSLITTKLGKRILERFNFKCFVCGAVDDLSIDHHYPLSYGYGLSMNNAVVLCAKCNSSKGAKMPEKFYNRAQLNKLWRLYGVGYGDSLIHGKSIQMPLTI